MQLRRWERFQDARTVYNQHGNQSLSAVAAATGITKSKIFDLEKDYMEKNENPRDVGAFDIAALAKYYGVTTDYLLGLTDDPDIKPCAADDLGLSIEAINKILELRSDPNSAARFLMPNDALEIANWIISNIDYEFLLFSLSNLCKAAKEYQSRKSKLSGDLFEGISVSEWDAVYGEARDKLDLAKYQASKTLDKILDYYIEDYCLHSIEHTKPGWEVIDDGND